MEMRTSAIGLAGYKIR